MSPAALMPPDGVSLVLLVAFAAWGAWRGGLRQLLTFVVLLAAFPLAVRLGPGLMGVVEKIVTVPGGDRPLVAWAAAFAFVLVVGGVLIAAFKPLLDRARLGGPLDRWLGAIFGVLQGSVLVSVVTCGLLLAHASHPRPSAIEMLARSTTARGGYALVLELGRTLGFPPEVEQALGPLRERVATGRISRMQSVAERAAHDVPSAGTPGSS